jgi:hypothetical protein
VIAEVSKRRRRPQQTKSRKREVDNAIYPHCRPEGRTDFARTRAIEGSVRNSGWSKSTGFSGAVAYTGTLGVPWPTLSAIVAIVIEFAFRIALGLVMYTQPLALLFALYTLVTAFVGHRYWTTTGAEHIANMNNF